VLSARPATIILLIFLGAQFGASLFVGLVAGITAKLNSEASNDSEALAAAVQQIMPFATIGAALAGGVAMLFCAFSMMREGLRDRSTVGAAWAFGSRKHILEACGVGLLVATGSLALSSIPALQPTHFAPGPLTKMALTPGLSRVLWLTIALLLAPPFEELLFRGVLYGGYRKSFGPGMAALLTTVLFCALHVTEIIPIPIAAVGIVALGVAALWMRLRSSAIGPAVALHFVYNAIIACAVFAGSTASH
jgi:membrane protease YdiL (CAAX protease family)